MDYPSEEEENLIIKKGTGASGDAPKPVLGIEHIAYLQGVVKRMPVADHVVSYAQKIAAGTRAKSPQALDFCKKWLSWGAGPRASLNLIMAAKAHAILRGQVYVSCDDVAAVALPIFRHRIIPNFAAQSEGIRRTTSPGKFWRRSRRIKSSSDVTVQNDTPPSKLLDPAAIQRAEMLGLQARSIVEGYMAGEHKSPFRGFAIEFTQHREYVPATISATSTGRSWAAPTAITSSNTSRRPTTSRTFSWMAASRWRMARRR